MLISEVESHPSRVRGLKFVSFFISLTVIIVAPFTGAWIEIANCLMRRLTSWVAPFTGAWIEITICPLWTGRLRRVAPFTGAWIEMSLHFRTLCPNSSSHPSRVRGLKSEETAAGPAGTQVAPFTGAWIEISSWQRRCCRSNRASHPSRVRGLKFRPRHHSWASTPCRTLHGCVD